MRTYLKAASLAIASLILLASSPQAYSQFTIPPPCDDVLSGCQPSWSTQTFVTNVSNNSCAFKLSYKVATNCGRQDIAILDLEEFPNNNCTFDQMYEEAMVRILSGNPQDLEPNEEGECDVTYRFTAGTCWEEVIEVDGTETIVHWQPCDATPCCITEFLVCNPTPGKDNRTWSLSSIPQDPVVDCELSCGSNSHDACEIATEDIDGRSPGATKPSNQLYFGTSEDLTITVYPNPARDRPQIVIEGAAGDEGVLQIYDAIGKLVLMQDVQFGSNGTSTVDADFSYLAEGMYSITLNIGDKITSSSLQILSTSH